MLPMLTNKEVNIPRLKRKRASQLREHQIIHNCPIHNPKKTVLDPSSLSLSRNKNEFESPSIFIKDSRRRNYLGLLFFEIYL